MTAKTIDSIFNKSELFIMLRGNGLIRFRKSFVRVFLFLIVFSSCTEKPHRTYTQNLIEKVEVLSPEAENILVDNFAHQIVLDFAAPADISSVQIRLVLADGVELVQPAEALSYFDLTNKPVIKLKYNEETFIYSFKINYFNSGFDPTSKGWSLSENFGDLPEYISVYKSPAAYGSKKFTGFIAVANISRGKFSVLGENYGYHTLSEFYESSSKPSVLMNAGYFWDGYALGLVVRDWKIIKEGNPMVYRSVGGETKTYYPTRAAFGCDKNGVFTAIWSYTSAGVIYSYPSPAPNKTGIEPKPIPSSTYPPGAVVWDPFMAIGAGPLLIKEGVYYNTWEAEMFDALSGVGPEVNNPRSAIGVTASGYLVFFVCEGRNQTPDTPGLTLKDVTDIMLDLGCTEAINLDGGGSSCMLVNGRETIKPSDGQQRKIVTAVAVY